MKASTKRLAIYALVVGFALFSVWSARSASEKAGRNAAALQAGLIESCEVNGNPLREAVQSILQEQIDRSRATPARFFPSIPPATFRRLVREQREANEAAIGSIEPIDCAAQYTH